MSTTLIHLLPPIVEPQILSLPAQEFGTHVQYSTVQHRRYQIHTVHYTLICLTKPTDAADLHLSRPNSTQTVGKPQLKLKPQPQTSYDTCIHQMHSQGTHPTTEFSLLRPPPLVPMPIISLPPHRTADGTATRRIAPIVTYCPSINRSVSAVYRVWVSWHTIPNPSPNLIPRNGHRRVTLPSPPLNPPFYPLFAYLSQQVVDIKTRQGATRQDLGDKRKRKATI